MTIFTTIHPESGRLYTPAEQREFQRQAEERGKSMTNDINRRQNHQRAISQAFERWKAPGGGALSAEQRIEISSAARCRAYAEAAARGKPVDDAVVRQLVARALDEAITARLEEDE